MANERRARNVMSFGRGPDVMARAGGMTRRDFIRAGSSLVLGAAVIGCGERVGGPDGSGGSAAVGEPPGLPWEGTDKAVDLIESLHLADIDHLGQFIDFGTAARFKYTLGGWMCGFDNDTAMNGISFTWASTSPSRVFFSLEKPIALRVRFRVKRGGTRSFSVYLNDKPISRVTFQGDDWEDHEVTTSAESAVAGENILKLVYETAERSAGKAPASFGVDYIWLRPEGPADPMEPTPPRLEGLHQRYRVDETERDALLLPLPITLHYYLEVPAGARLCFGACPAVNPNAPAKSTVGVSLAARLTPVDGEPSREILSRSWDRPGWSNEMADLSFAAGRLARLEIVATGTAGARLALAEPAVRVQRPRVVEASRRAKNAIVLLVDTERADRLSVYGQTRVQSPVMEKFAREATLFERCQAVANWTKPSCATVLTGLYPDTHKARGESSKLSASVRLASEMFGAAGFATGAFIANGYLAAEFGFNRGWNTYRNFIRESRPSEADKVFAEALAWIQARQKQPFFAYVHTIDPHVPYDPPADDLKLYDPSPYEGPVRPRSTGSLLEEIKRGRVQLEPRDRRRLEALYDGEVTFHDRWFGHFLDGLKALGVLDETIIVVCADHGEEFFEHGSVGHGHTLHQELLHVPLAVRAPGLVPPGARLAQDVSQVDVLPTVLSATGLPIPEELEGNDLLPFARGALPDPLAAAFSSFYSEADERNLSHAVRKGEWKLRMHGPARTFLYRLSDDPREQTDVDERYPLALRAMRIALGQFIGAPDKRDWRLGKLAQEVVPRPEAKQEAAEVPDDLKAQLRALGYAQ